MSGNVHQSDPKKLKATVVLAAGNEVEVTQGTAADLLATVTQHEKDRTVTGSVTANAGTNLNTSGLAITNPETDNDGIVGGEVRETSVVLLYGWNDDGPVWERIRTDAFNRLQVEAHQATAADLKATVTQAAKDRTISGTSSGTYAGDLARKAYYDQDSGLEIQRYEATVGSHSFTTRWTYTVPNNRKAIHSVCSGFVSKDVATATKTGQLDWRVRKYGGSLASFIRVIHTDGDGYVTSFTATATFAMNEGDAIDGRTFSNDTVDHTFQITSLLTEFDE